MKRLFYALALLLIASPLMAAQQTILGGSGVLWGDEKGKINSNFSEIYGWVGQGVKTTSNPSFNSVHASGGNLAAANAQVTKKWITGLSYTADVTSVIHGGKHFICSSTHTAGSTTEPGVGASWATVWKYAGEVIDASGFNGNLATTDDTLQEVAQKLDDLVAGGDDLGTAAASDVVALFNSGTCSGYLKSDGQCDTPTGGYTNLTSFVGQTAWRIFYSNADGDVTELALGASGEYLKSNGASAAPSWATPSGAAHDAVTLSTDLGNNLLGLSTQQITLDSQTANYIFAAPNSSAGVPSFRAMVDGDIPSTIARDSELPTASSLSVDDLITLSGVSTGAVNLGSFTGATIDDNLTIKAALQDVETSFEAKLPAGTDGQYGVWLSNNTTNPNTYSTGKWGYTVYNNAPYWCYNGTCTAIPSAGFANPMTTAGDMIKGGTSGAAARMVPGTGVVTLLETPTSANFFSAITGETGSGAVVGGTAPGFTTSANPATADGATLGTTALEWSDIYLAAGGVIYGENGQENSLTSSATGWTANLDFTISGSDLILGAAGVQFTGDGDGAVTLLGRGDGSDEDMTINLDDTANVIGVSSSTGATAMRLDMALQAPIVFNSYTSAQTLTAAAHNSTLVQMTTADEVTMWDCETANVGQHVVLWARDAEKIEVVPASGDQFYLFAGTGIGANDELDMAATAGTKVTLMCTADDSWSVVYETAACTDGGAAD